MKDLEAKLTGVLIWLLGTWDFKDFALDFVLLRRYILISLWLSPSPAHFLSYPLHSFPLTPSIIFLAACAGPKGSVHLQGFWSGFAARSVGRENEEVFSKPSCTIGNKIFKSQIFRECGSPFVIIFAFMLLRIADKGLLKKNAYFWVYLELWRALLSSARVFPTGHFFCTGQQCLWTILQKLTEGHDYGRWLSIYCK